MRLCLDLTDKLSPSSLNQEKPISKQSTNQVEPQDTTLINNKQNIDQIDNEIKESESHKSILKQSNEYSQYSRHQSTSGESFSNQTNIHSNDNAPQLPILQVSLNMNQLSFHLLPGDQQTNDENVPSKHSDTNKQPTTSKETEQTCRNITPPSRDQVIQQLVMERDTIRTTRNKKSKFDQNKSQKSQEEIPIQHSDNTREDSVTLQPEQSNPQPSNEDNFQTTSNDYNTPLIDIIQVGERTPLVEESRTSDTYIPVISRINPQHLLPSRLSNNLPRMIQQRVPTIETTSPSQTSEQLALASSRLEPDPPVISPQDRGQIHANPRGRLNSRNARVRRTSRPNVPVHNLDNTNNDILVEQQNVLMNLACGDQPEMDDSDSDDFDIEDDSDNDLYYIQDAG